MFEKVCANCVFQSKNKTCTHYVSAFVSSIKTSITSKKSRSQLMNVKFSVMKTRLKHRNAKKKNDSFSKKWKMTILNEFQVINSFFRVDHFFEKRAYIEHSSIMILIESASVQKIVNIHLFQLHCFFFVIKKLNSENLIDVKKSLIELNSIQNLLMRRWNKFLIKKMFFDEKHFKLRFSI